MIVNLITTQYFIYTVHSDGAVTIASDWLNNVKLNCKIHGCIPIHIQVSYQRK